jgi:hypothetical protein
LRPVDFASDNIMTHLLSSQMERRTSQLMQFVDATTSNPVWSTTNGKIFENHLGHVLLRAGGDFSVQQFSDPTNSKSGFKSKRELDIGVLNLTPTTTVRKLASAASIGDLCDGEYGQPDKSNFPTIDSAMKPAEMPNLLFQFTVASEHGVNIDGLIAAVSGMRLGAGDPTPRLYFVVPPTQFHSFKVGSFTSSKKPATKISDIPPVEYWVLQLYGSSSLIPATIASDPTRKRRAVASDTTSKRQAVASSSSSSTPLKVSI